VILGLALLEPPLQARLEEQDGAFTALAREVTPPLEQTLTPQGVQLWPLLGVQLRAEKPAQKQPEVDPAVTETQPAPERIALDQTVPMQTDGPARIDQLQRRGFARVLAARLRYMRATDTGCFLVHLGGKWGSGKSSLLHFIGEELKVGRQLPLFGGRTPRHDTRWIVVDFNAWQHQRIVPPWWWLLCTVETQGRNTLWRLDRPRAVLFHLRRAWWRASAGIWWYVTGLIGAAVVGAIWLWWSSPVTVLHMPKHPLGWFTSAAAGVSGAIVIVGALRGMARTMTTRSARRAREYLRQARDPMQAAKEHFADVVSWLRYPVAIFVDDLDRCRGAYVVELLEGVQTLFRGVPIVYVVAADPDWLADSYAKEYRAFVSLQDEPGRPLGYLFLEKTFQLSASVPGMGDGVLSRFWKGLIQRDGPLDEATLDQARAAADAAFARLETQDEIQAEIERDPGSTPAEQQARHEAMAMKLAAPEHREEVEHVLAPFSALLDRNPRSLKRLVNAFGVARDIEILSGWNVGGDVSQQHETALWAILSLRWPRLVEHLEVNHADIEAIGNGSVPRGVPNELRPLFDDPRVIRVVQGDAPNVQAKLDHRVVERCAGLF